MEKGDRIAAAVESIASDGSGVARVDGLAVFLPMTAPGDRVTARITERHRTWARAGLLGVEEASPRRVEPRCPEYGNCGGCTLQHLDYGAQIEAKKEILAGAFVRIGGFPRPEIRAVPSPPWGCRNRVQLHRTEAGLGFLRRRSGDCCVLQDCPLADGGIRGLLADSAAGDGATPAGRAKSRFAVYSRKNLLLQEGGNPSRGETELLDRKIRLDAAFFFQGNAFMQEILIRDLLREAAAAPGGRAADIYAGVGVFALFLADIFGSLSLAEENPGALALARENLAGAGGNAAFFAGRAADFAGAEMGKGAFSFAVTDPPRTGMERKTAALLAVSGPPVLACVSCDSATLARDAKILRQGGYRLRSLCLYDFYPQTAHIESLAVFEKDCP